jgi:uncharacterized alpha-E superfamily protein
MLSRTANDLYWMSRHIERAENIARMLDVTYRMSLLPYRILEPGEKWAEPWALPLIINGLATSYYQRYSDLQPEHVLHFMTLDASNPSSIYASLQTARENARAQRGAISNEMWESLNDTWLAIRNKTFADIGAGGVSPFFDWVKDRSHLFRGVTFGTMIRDEGFSFIRLGTFLERADNTARILDVKYYVLLPHNEIVGGEIDSVQWAAILRSVSAHRSYRWVYKDSYKPWQIADYLILNRQMPRSLHSCYEEIASALDQLGGFYGSSNGCQSLARETRRLLAEGDMSAIFQSGLHEFLADFLARNNRLACEISAAYHFTDVAVPC